MRSIDNWDRFDWPRALLGIAVLLVYAPVLPGLVRQWLNDDNYSFGLLVPFVIAFIIWSKFDEFRNSVGRPEVLLGFAAVVISMLLFVAGGLGAELFTTRISLAVLLAGLVIYFFGRRLLRSLTLPFILLLLAIPIPQIILNKIAFPLQLLASRIAAWGLLTSGIACVRQGNIIQIMPAAGAKPIWLEVAEACSGIRSLISLVTLALLLRYFARRRFSDLRATPPSSGARRFALDATVVAAAIPIALLTNAARIYATGLASYFFGERALESPWHEAFGWMAFLLALIALIAVNEGLSRVFKTSETAAGPAAQSTSAVASGRLPAGYVLALLVPIIVAGTLTNWAVYRTKPQLSRERLTDFPARLGDAFQVGGDIKFDPATESFLGSTDYIMRDYLEVSKASNRWRRFDLYIGYYGSQHTGATYHSPENCLPGAGWQLLNGQQIEVEDTSGRFFPAKQYDVEYQGKSYVMVYWYQGRGRRNASEYADKLDAIFDGISKGRSDGALVRVITGVDTDETREDAARAAEDFAGKVEAAATGFVPD